MSIFSQPRRRPFPRASQSRSAECRRLRKVRFAAVETLEARRLLTAYYADANATTNGSGTESSPWNTLASASSQSYNSSGGDTLYLQGTFTGTTLTLGGNVHHGITVTSYGSGTPSITDTTGGNTCAVTITTSTGVTFENINFSNISFVGIKVSASNVTIQNVNMTSGDSNTGIGVWFESYGSGAPQYTDETITDVNTTGFEQAGLEVRGGDGTTSNYSAHGFSYVDISGSHFNNSSGSGLVVMRQDSDLSADTDGAHVNDHLTINNCYAYNNSGAYMPTGGDAGFLIESVSDGLVENSFADANCADCNGGVGFEAAESDTLTIENDESKDTAIEKSSTNTDGDGFDLDHGVTNSTIEYCYSHGNDGLGFLVCTSAVTACPTAVNELNSETYGNVVQFNISDDNGLVNESAANLPNTAGIGTYSAAGYPVGYNVSGAVARPVMIFCNTVLAGSADSGFASPCAISVFGNDNTDTVNSRVNFFNNILYTTGTDLLVSTNTSVALNTSNAVFQGNDYFASGESNDFRVKWGSTTYSLMDTSGSTTGWRTATGEEKNGATNTGLAYPSSADPKLNDETVSDLAINDIANLGLLPTSPVFGHGISLNASTYAITQDYFDDPVASGTTIQDIGAEQTGSINISSGTVTIPALAGNTTLFTRYFSEIRIADGAEAILGNASQHSGRSLVVVSSGGLADSGTFDLGGNDMVVRSGSILAVTALLKQGFNISGSIWAGVGNSSSGAISSSVASTDTTHLTAIGSLLNSAGLFGTSNLFDGYAPSTSDVLLKYTYYGDANLDGQVTGQPSSGDYTYINNGYNHGLTGWQNGDFNYDGLVDGSDYTLIDNAYLNQGSEL